MTAKVSILIPCYEVQKFLSETILSALDQTWPNTEIIIVDDGSTDNSLSIARKFESERVHVYEQENKGACAARNLAFHYSTGEYIQYLDADDLLAPDKIEQQMKIFNKEGNEVIVSGRWGRFYDNPNEVRWEQQPVDKDYLNPVEWLIDSWTGKGMTAQHAWLTPRHLIEQAGLWNESLAINQDGEFFSRVLMQAKSIHYCNTAKVYYRSGNPTSISQSRPNRAKAQSLLHSYQLYKNNVGHYLENRKVRIALANNFLHFIYLYHSRFPDLTQKAEDEFKDLEVGKMWPVGGKRFKQFAKVVGFKNALMFRTML